MLSRTWPFIRGSKTVDTLTRKSGSKASTTLSRPPAKISIPSVPSLLISVSPLPRQIGYVYLATTDKGPVDVAANHPSASCKPDQISIPVGSWRYYDRIACGPRQPLTSLKGLHFASAPLQLKIHTGVPLPNRGIPKRPFPFVGPVILLRWFGFPHGH